jgi:hypothetical protein
VKQANIANGPQQVNNATHARKKFSPDKTNYWRTPTMSAWTPERRQRQREAIQRWKPWKQSTGPRSLEGKARAARNAWTGGHTVKLRQLTQGTESGDESAAGLA